MSWWGTFEIPEGRAGRFRIGPLDLWAERRKSEWRIAFDRHEDPYDPTLSIEAPREPIDLLALTNVFRYAMGGGDAELTLSAKLSDRPVVTRPEKTVVIPPGEELIVYVTTPLWIALKSGGENGKPLCEVGVQRPQDTWFGPTNLEGELCYANRAFWRTEMAELKVTPHRAVTRVRIQNDAPSPLQAERLNLPVPRLRLWCSTEGRLWTDDVMFVRTEGDEFATLRLDSKESTNFASAGAKRLSEPRVPTLSNVVLRAFNSLFG
jgi:hypothetical protein